MAKVTAMDVYKLLPQTNCGDCGEASCMAFATKLSEKKADLILCTELDDKSFKKLDNLLVPAVKEILIGKDDKAKIIGGDEVLYRYEESYYNQTLFAIDLPDDLEESEFNERIKTIENIEFERTGELLKLDAIALRNKSEDPSKFAEAAKKLKSSKYPVFLVTLDPIAMQKALEVIGGDRSLMYAATKDNLFEMAELAKEYDCPLTVFSPGDIEKMKDLVFTLRSNGIDDIVLDPGTLTGEAIGDTLDNFVMSRRLAIEDKDEDFRFPLLGVPALVRLNNEDDEVKNGTMEATIASTLMNKYADVLILKGTDIWELIPILTLRQSLYTDPRKPQAVDPGIYEFGDVNENSPVLLTTNFALTYYTVEGDLKSGNASTYLLVLDTIGKAVDVAIAGGQFDGKAVADLVKKCGIEDKVKTRKMIIPGLAAPLSGEIEDETGWDVMVGPRDSSAVPDFIDEKF
ncbi:Acetyl-CoA decarbonylase/synthase complex subunit gamma 1 [Candidatus Methanobinarius endosymbioticus]|uniref:Acetyl-CoA decarbonylase/synthase complex subunit gamma n=1 Tax=Candidatus Methanobinarius endosymbioticus TaxID=2006182 RepID=A0A366MBE3_9EURY|nr:Acetyl-CoA decarbonylase/synthase complex subunit gamma 1 [Candidatus Methanobinarius endosymbioticus]